MLPVAEMEPAGMNRKLVGNNYRYESKHFERLQDSRRAGNGLFAQTIFSSGRKDPACYGRNCFSPEADETARVVLSFGIVRLTTLATLSRGPIGYVLVF